jgi:hypothetical protein
MLEVTHGEDACYICYINALLPAHFGLGCCCCYCHYSMLEVTHGEDACYICYINALLPAHFGPCYFLMLNIMMCSSPHVRENV